MQLKRIVARDLRAASEQAVLDYGKNALFISTVEAHGMTELIIAVEHASPPVRPADSSTPQDLDASWSSGGEHDVHRGIATSYPLEQPAHERHIVDAVREEIAQLRKEMMWAGRIDADALAPAPCPEVKAMLTAMVHEGVPARLQARLTSLVLQSQSAAHAVARLGDELGKLLEPKFSPPPNGDWSGTHVLYGAPGAGKTLMCARLVSLAASRLGADNVAWISFQDNRMGAWSQTQALAAQCGVDAFRARDAESLSVLFAELTDRDAVFVDTAHSDGRQLATVLATFMNVEADAQLHAVVAADASIQALRRLAAAAEGSSLLVTRFDIAERPWPLIDHLLDGRPWQVRAVSGTPWTSAADTSLEANARKLLESTLIPLLGDRLEPTMSMGGTDASGVRHD